MEVPWSVADPEAGELESPKIQDPRPTPAPGPVTSVLPLPLFPFLPSKSDLPVEHNGETALFQFMYTICSFGPH